MQQPQVLRVRQKVLADAFKALRKRVKRKEKPEVIFTFDGSIMTIDVAGASVRIEGEGSLSGQAFVHWQTLLPLATFPPTGDPVAMRGEGERLYFGSSSITCHWEESAVGPVELPLDAPLSMVLRLRLDYTEEQIEKCGYTQTLLKAERKKKSLVHDASELLRPLGVDQRDVAELVDKCLTRLNRV
jgi:hypothetical protein